MSLDVVLTHAQQLPTELVASALPIAVRKDVAATSTATDGAPTVLSVDATGNLRTTGAGSETITSLSPGTLTANLGKASSQTCDATQDVGVAMLGVRQDLTSGPITTSLVDNAGDYVPFSITETGALRCETTVRAVRTATTITGSSWASGDSEGAQSMNGYRSMSFAILFDDVTASNTNYLTVEVSDDGSTYFPLQEVTFQSIRDSAGATKHVCRGTVSGIPHEYIRISNFDVTLSTGSKLLFTRYNS